MLRKSRIRAQPRLPSRQCLPQPPSGSAARSLRPAPGKLRPWRPARPQQLERGTRREATQQPSGQFGIRAPPGSSAGRRLRHPLAELAFLRRACAADILPSANQRAPSYSPAHPWSLGAWRSISAGEKRISCFGRPRGRVFFSKMAASHLRQAVGAAGSAVKPIFSRDLNEAKRRVRELYRAWYREVPNTGERSGARGAPEAASRGLSHPFSRAGLRASTWAGVTPGASWEEGHPSIGGPAPAAAAGSDQQCPSSESRFGRAPLALWLFCPP